MNLEKWAAKRVQSERKQSTKQPKKKAVYNRSNYKTEDGDDDDNIQRSME